MDSAELRKLANELRGRVQQSEGARLEKAAQVLDAAVAIYRLQQKVRGHV